jgi:hypothetical protein
LPPPLALRAAPLHPQVSVDNAHPAGNNPPSRSPMLAQTRLSPVTVASLNPASPVNLHPPPAISETSLSAEDVASPLLWRPIWRVVAGLVLARATGRGPGASPHAPAGLPGGQTTCPAAPEGPP